MKKDSNNEGVNSNSHDDTAKKHDDHHDHHDNHCGCHGHHHHYHDDFFEPYVRSGDKIGRNDECPCGSGKKFKKCCMDS